MFKEKRTTEEEANVAEGIENCVTKNLYPELFNEGSPKEEHDQNELIEFNIQKFGSFVRPKHLEFSEERIDQERL